MLTAPLARKEQDMDQEIHSPKIREALELLEEYGKGGLHGTSAGQLWSAVMGTLLIVLGLALIFG